MKLGEVLLLWLLPSWFVSLASRQRFHAKSKCAFAQDLPTPLLRTPLRPSRRFLGLSAQSDAAAKPGSTARNNSTLASLSSILGPPTPTSPTPARPSMSSRSSMSTRSKIVKKRDSFEGKRVAKLRVGDLVVVGSELADLGLMERESYEIRAIYYKRIGYDGQRRATYGGPSRVNVHTVGDVLPQTVKDDPRGWLLWVELFNPRYHSKPVAVRPERLGLTTVFEEISVGIGMVYPLWLLAVGAFFGSMVLQYILQAIKSAH